MHKLCYDFEVRLLNLSQVRLYKMSYKHILNNVGPSLYYKR